MEDKAVTPVPPLMQPQGARQWWLVLDGTTAGPYSEAQILQRLGQEAFGPNTPACPVDDHRWQPLQNWEQFAGVFPSANGGSTGRSIKWPTELGRSLWNYALPWQANVICIYCLLMQPGLAALFIVQSIISGSGAETQDDLDRIYNLIYGNLQSLMLAVFFVAAGIGLRQLSRIAVYLVPTVFAVSLANFIAGLVALLLSFVFLFSLPVELSDSVPPFTSADAAYLALWVFLVLISIACAGFEVFALLWWHHHRQDIPWTKLTLEKALNARVLKSHDDVSP